jgi:uncharacterized protein
MDEDGLRLPRVGLLFRWAAAPESWSLVGDQSPTTAPGHAGETAAGGNSVLRISAGARTDLFVDPLGGPALLNAPRLLASPGGDFQLSARVEVDFVSVFDAGVVLLWAAETSWAKLCFELSPQGQPMVVSVVNRNLSDDANAFDVDGPAVWLRISRIDGAYAFHASNDARMWRFVRNFALDPPAGAALQVGFEAQSPTGEGCTARFSHVVYAEKRLAELRSGV